MVFQEGALHADFLVLQGVGTVTVGLVELIDAAWARRDGAGRAVEGTRPETLGEGVIGHDIRRDMPCDVAAALQACVGLAVIGGVDVDKSAHASAIGNIEAARPSAVLGAHLELAILIPARATGNGENVRDDVIVDRSEERSLVIATLCVLAKGGGVAADARIVGR